MESIDVFHNVKKLAGIERVYDIMCIQPMCTSEVEAQEHVDA